MTEQETITAPSENATLPSTERRSAKDSKPSSKKTVAQPAKKSTQRAPSLTDEQKRLARNAALREWRKKNADRVKAYMTEWREKRKGQQPATSATPATARSAHAAAAKKKSTSKTRKGGKA